MLRAKAAIRWFIALPAGLLAAAAIMFPVHWVIMYFYSWSGTNPDAIIQSVGADGEYRGCNFVTCLVPAESLERIIQAFVMPYVTMLVIARIVPSHKFYAVFSFFVVYLLVLGGVTVRGSTNGAYTGWGWLELAAVVALGVTGALSVLYGQFQTWRDAKGAVHRDQTASLLI